MELYWGWGRQTGAGKVAKHNDSSSADLNKMQHKLPLTFGNWQAQDVSWQAIPAQSKPESTKEIFMLNFYSCELKYTMFIFQ